jgi:hypothetical protein
VKTFRSVILLKRPQQELWTNMRDHLVEFGEYIADIESIRQIERTIDADGKICIVNEWTVQRALPAALITMLKVDKFSWIDRNKWDEANKVCSWTIQPAVFGEHIACSGETQFTAAMGNLGTRITFVGELEIKPALLAAVGSVGPMMSGFVESIVTTMIPRNMRAVAEAAAEFGGRDRDYPINAP